MRGLTYTGGGKRRRQGHPPSYVEVKKMKSQALLHVILALRDGCPPPLLLLLLPFFFSSFCLGPSIKYVTLFSTNFDPIPPSVTLCHTSRNPFKVRHTFRNPPKNPNDCPGSIYTPDLCKQRSIKLQ